MKLNIEIDFKEFYSEFESFDDFVRANIKREIEKAIRSHPEMKAHIKAQADKAVKSVLEAA